MTGAPPPPPPVKRFERFDLPECCGSQTRAPKNCRGSRRDQKKNPALEARGISFFRVDDLVVLVVYLVPTRHNIPVAAGVKGFVIVHFRAAGPERAILPT